MNPKQIEEFFHLTPVQKHVLRQSEHANPQAHLAQFSCHLEGALDVSAFERAWQKVTDHQPALRAAFVSGDLKEPVQYINRNLGVELEKHDWRNLSAVDQVQRLSELLKSDRQSEFVLKAPPLWRMTLIRLAEDRHHFIWTYHELLFDERSLPLLFNEALLCYEAILHVQKIPLGSLPSMRKYVDWVKRKDPLATEQFWRVNLKGFHSPTPITPSQPEMTVQLPVEKAGTLNALATQQYLEPAVMAYGAWALLLSRLSGQTEVVFGVQVSGRLPQFQGSDRLVGHLRNMVPFRVRIAPDAMVVEWLTELQTKWEELQHYGYASLRQIQSWSEIPASQSLFESVVVFDSGQPDQSIKREIDGLQIQYDTLISPNHFPLAIMIKDRGAWELTGDAHVVPMRSVLEQFAIAPQRRLAEIVLPSEQVHSATMAAGAAVLTPPPPELPIHWSQPEEEEQGWVTWLKGETCIQELFEERVAQSPDVVAVRLRGESLTYRELNARANQLARYLRKLNVMPSIPVGVCFTPSVAGVVGMLGVLKAGGAYLPLDAAQSADELAQVVTDAAISVLLTQASLESKFRAIPMHCVVLCLDSDWAIIAEEESENLACQVSDEHPACYLIEGEMPVVITHAHLAKALSTAKQWFDFNSDNPWRLFTNLPTEPVAPPVSTSVSNLVSTPTFTEDVLSDVTPAPESSATTPAAPSSTEEMLSEMNRGMDWFDMTPEPVQETEMETEWTLNPDPDFDLEVEGSNKSSSPVSSSPQSAIDQALVSDPSGYSATLEQNSGPEKNNDVTAYKIHEESLSLAPVQQWFLAQRLVQPHHWNVSLMVEIGDSLDQTMLEESLQAVINHHPALRSRFVETESGWQCEEFSAPSLPFEFVDFSARWARSQRKAIEETADQMQSQLHLSDGPLWRAAYFDLGGDRLPRLLIIAHHLIADETSLRIFLDDWLTAYYQLHRQQAVVLPPQTASHQEWLQSLTSFARPEEPSQWQQIKTASLNALPIDNPDGANTYKHADRVFVSLNQKETESLFQEVVPAAKADVNEIALTALTLALTQWAGENAVLLELERDARTSSALDVTRTIGWLTATYPLRLEIEPDVDLTESLEMIKAQLRVIQHQGATYGLWRYHSNAATSLQALPQPQIRFKYFAPSLFAPEDDSLWRVASESVGLEHHPDNERQVVIAISCAMNLNMLEFRWDYAGEQFEQKNIGSLVNRFIEELRRLIHYFTQTEMDDEGAEEKVKTV